jgi:hypothetical protein
MSQKQMRIGMSLRGHGYHLAAWRHPDVPADASVRLDHYIHTAQTAERGSGSTWTALGVCLRGSVIRGSS